MKTALVLFVSMLFCVAVGAADRPTSVSFTAGNVTRSMTVPGGSYSKAQLLVTESLVNGVCTFHLGTTQNPTGGQWVRFTAPCDDVRRVWTYPAPPHCDAVPPDATQEAPCPNGAGTFHQSHGWDQAPPPGCQLTARAWVPSVPGAADCQTAPPPGGALRMDFGFVDHASTKYRDFIAFANRTDEADPQTLVWAYKTTGDVSYCQRAVPMIDAWMRSPGQIAGDSYLQIDQFLAPMAMAEEWCPNVTAAQHTQWIATGFQVLDAMWGRGCAGWAVCDFQNNYHNHFVRATVYVAIASGDPARIAFAMQKWNEQNAAQAAMLPDGGSLEGMGYFYSVKWLDDTAMVIRDSGFGDVFNANAYLSDSALVWVHGTTPDLAHFAPIGSQTQGSDAPLNDYRRGLVGSSDHQTGDASAKLQMNYWLANIFQDVYRANSWDNLWTYPTTTTPPPLVYKAQRVGIFGRTAWNPSASYVVTVAGDRTQSHAHAEQGEVMVWKGGWLTVPGHVFSRSGINGEAPGYSGRAKNVMGFYATAGAAKADACRAARAPLAVSPIKPTSKTEIALADAARAIATREQANRVNACNAPNAAVEIVQQPGVPIVSNYSANQATGDYTVCLDMSALYASGVTLWKRCNEVVGGVATVTDYVQVAPGVSARQQWVTASRSNCSGQNCATATAKFTVVQPASPAFTHTALPTLDGDFTSGDRLDIPCDHGCATKVGPTP